MSKCFMSKRPWNMVRDQDRYTLGFCFLIRSMIYTLEESILEEGKSAHIKMCLLHKCHICTGALQFIKNPLLSHSFHLLWDLGKEKGG